MSLKDGKQLIKIIGTQNMIDSMNTRILSLTHYGILGLRQIKIKKCMRGVPRRSMVGLGTGLGKLIDSKMKRTGLYLF